MNLSIALSYPYWFILICLAAGSGFAYLLYRRIPREEFNKRTVWVLSGLRFLSVSLITFLLLSPLIKTISSYTEKPIIILAADNSESITIGKDSTYYKTEFTKNFQDLADALSKDYDVRTYTFADQLKEGLSLDYKGKQTDMGSVFSEVINRFTNQNAAAVILASDGIYTKGSDPLYASENISFPVFTIALGDTNRNKDLVISHVNYNRIAYLGNDFPLEITVAGYQAAGSKTRLTVSSGDQQFFSTDITLNSANETRTFTTKLAASKTGMQRYQIRLQPIAGEVSTANNVQDIFVEVIDDRQKILLLANSPHPDIAAIRQAIEQNQNYEVTYANINDFTDNISKYNLVILHQLPSVTNSATQIFNQLKNNPVSVLYILGNQTNLQAFNALQAGVTIPPSNATKNTANPVVNNSFALFSLPAEVTQIVPELPPLQVPFGQYQTKTASDVLMYQKIGTLTTQYPLITFSNSLQQKNGIIAGEGIWRWRMNCFAKTGNHNGFDQLMSKIVQYLAVKDDKSQFRVFVKNHFFENEAIELNAELYNDSYELVNQPEVSMVITDENKKAFPFTFSPTSNAYYLNAGSLAPGSYTYAAKTAFGGKTFEKSGKFIIMPLNVEVINTVANHSLLYNLAQRHGGEMLYPKDIGKIKELLEKRDDIKTVRYTQKRFTNLIDQFWILLLIIGLVGAEWFVRKYNGSY